MDYTFVVNGDESARKRKAPQGACDTCKKRKKRCTHNMNSTTAYFQDRPPESDMSHLNGPRRNRRQSQSEVRYASHSIEPQRNQPQSPPVVRYASPSVDASPTHGHTRGTRSLEGPALGRFIGDLNPEASLVAEQDPGSGDRDRHDVGVWVGHDGQRSAKVSSQGQNQPNDASSLAALLLPDALIEGIPLQLQRSDLTALVEIYSRRINVVLPLVDDNSISKAATTDTSSSTLLQAMCLVAAKDPAAEQYLRAESHPTYFKPSVFASTLYASLKIQLSKHRERDRLCLIRVLALMSLHSEGPEGAEDASAYLAQAVHHAQTIGLHLGRTDGHRDTGSHTRLFWALWCMSKLNAALNGRPQLIFDADIGFKIEEVHELLQPPTKVLSATSQLLSRVIEIYKPSRGDATGIDEEFESFDNIIEKCQAQDIECSILTSLELYYHSIAILSHRTRRRKGEEKIPVPTLSSLRQELSALKIVTILRQVSPVSLLPLPVVHYSISLAMSSFYREMRETRRGIKKAAARDHLECCVEALESIDDRSWPANNMAKIGRKALKQTAPMDDLHTHSHRLTQQRSANMRTSTPLDQQYLGHFGESLQMPADYRGPVGEGEHREDALYNTEGDTGLHLSYDELIDMDAVFGDFLNLNLPDFGLPL